MSLTKEDGFWRILNDSYEDEYQWAWPKGTDFDKLLASLPETLRTLEGEMNQPRSILLQPGEVGIQSTVVYYDRNKASWYGKTWTDDSGTFSSANYNTANFLAYATTDCQNFVSQAVWWGFGGTSADRSLPMVNNIPGATAWWADRSNATGSWATAPTFYSMILDNQLYNKIGVHGSAGQLAQTMVGDVMKISTPDGEHVYLVTQIDNIIPNGYTDYSEIHVSAHSRNRNNHLFSDLYPTPPPGLEYRWIQSFLWP
ncbi:MAG TPA: amidase domain-containing protein [Bacillota bacterium]